MFILNHIVSNLETNDTLVTSFIFETKEQAEEAKAKLETGYKLINNSSLDTKVYSDIKEINICTDNHEIIEYLNELNNIKFDIDEEYTEKEYEEIKKQINIK